MTYFVGRAVAACKAKAAVTVSLVSVFCLLLSACSTLSRSQYQADQDPKVAVVSLLGSKVGIYYQGVTVFGNQYKEVELSPFDPDSLYQQRIETVLERDMGYQVVHVDYDADAWLALEDDRDTWSAGRIFARPVNLYRYRENLKALADQHNLDAVFVLVPSSTQTGSAVEPEGISMFVTGRNEKVTGAFGGVAARLFLVDGETQEEVADTQLRKKGFINPYRPLENKPFKNLRETPLASLAVRDETEKDRQALAELFSTVVTDEFFQFTLEKILKPY